MGTNEQKLKEIADKMSKIRVFENADGVQYFNEEGVFALENLSKDADVIRENFKYFSKKTFAILHPEEFFKIIQNIDGGRQMIADNLEYILNTFVNKKARARLSLVGIPEVSKKVAEDFENLFNAAMYRGEPATTYDKEPSLRYVPCCAEQNKTDFSIFLQYVIGADNPADILEANKDLFLNYAFNSGMLDMVKVLSKNPKCHQFIRNNFEAIKENCYVPHLAELYTNVRDICPEEFSKEAFTIDNIYLPAIEKLETKNENGMDYSIVLDQINVTCSEIIKHGRTADYEKLVKFINQASNDNTFKVCGLGSYNIIMQVGDKILKVGGKESDRKDRDSFKIPYHPRILLPTIRKKDGVADPDHPLVVGLYETVDVDSEITDEEVLEVYKELREAGIRWIDVKKENLGRLKKDNLQYEFGSNMPAPLEYLGFEDIGIERKTLKAGDIVIIDVDELYTDGKADKMPFINGVVPKCVIEYEKEYMARKEAEKAKKLERKPEAPSPHDEH